MTASHSLRKRQRDQNRRLMLAQTRQAQRRPSTWILLVFLPGHHQSRVLGWEAREVAWDQEAIVSLIILAESGLQGVEANECGLPWQRIFFPKVPLF